MAILLILAWLLTCQAEFRDEMQAFDRNCLGENVFECFDGTCISDFRFCDGISDCPDASDEIVCPTLVNPSLCNGNLHFLCADESKCLLNSFVCNNVSDCSDGSDEVNCTFSPLEKKNTSCKGFSCDGNKCISDLWTCDSQYDCADKTDESVDACRHKPSLSPSFDFLFNMDTCGTIMKLPDGIQKTYLCRDSSYCLPSSMMCDGIVDCKDGSDEEEFCINWNKVCASNPCNNTKCLPTRYSFFCMCEDSKSQQYNYSTNQCEHIDVCYSPRPYCSHICEMSEMGYKCLCEKGYNSEKSGASCSAAGPEAILFYSTISEIGYITLKSKKQVTLATGIKQTHGLTYDGEFLYWVETAQGHQAIMRAEMRNIEDTKQVIVSLGLEDPGDIALDWMGGHIYFSDAERGIIAVCRSDGSMCTTLPVNAKSPKFVTLAVKYGKMFWADWHQKPVIMAAQMDGSASELFMDNLNNFATGLTVDVPNNRLYYVDHTVKVIRIDNKQTYSLFSEPFRHPYAIAVFENNVYWSDMISHSIQITEKLHGSGEKKEQLITLNSSVFDMHIYHPLLIGYFDRAKSPCVNKSCSHLCLLTSKDTSVCACPDGMKLNGTTCHHVKEFAHQYLIIAAGKQFTRVQYNGLGNPEGHATRINLGWVQAMAHDNVRDTLYIYDGKYKNIESINMSEFARGVTTIPYRGFDDVVDMDYDYATDSLYILDAGSQCITVISLRTQKRALVYHFKRDEIPISFCIVPEYGKMLIAIREGETGDIHIDSLGLDGSDRKHLITNELKGPGVRLRYAHNMDYIYFADEGNSMIDLVNPEGEGRESFKLIPTSVRDLAVTDSYIFWTDRRTQRLFWSDMHDISHWTRRIELKLFPNDTHLHLQATRPPPGPNNLLMNHPCLFTNTCSDVCVQTPHPHPGPKKEITLGYKCLCPSPLVLVDGKCFEVVKCKADELFCHSSNECVLKGKRCDGKQDCRFGEDEKGCETPLDVTTEKPQPCGERFISCNGMCIDRTLSCTATTFNNQSAQCEPTQWLCKTDSLCVERSQVCDGQIDCPDGSDESAATCDTLTCQDYEFTCTIGYCIMSAFKCDGDEDCSDGSDEENCEYKNCTVGHFQCRDRECIELGRRCDGNIDCADESDEEQCQETVFEKEVEAAHCAAEEYACELDQSICLPASARCNWKVECPGGTDELDCDLVCAPRVEFRCGKELKCITKDKVCNGKKDCDDASDETPEACQYLNRTSYHHTPPPFLAKECTHGYLCNTGDCLEWRQVCDGVIHCFDASDENGQCSTACQNKTCSYTCQPTPNGPRCECPRGLQLDNDQRTCVDIDECADDVCSQNCHNIYGSFLCSCYHGYTLRSDRHSCKAIQGTMSILYVSGNTVRSLSADGHSVLEYNDENIARIGGIDANIREHKLYVTAPDVGKLIQVRGPNTPDNVTVVTNVGTPTKVAVDWLTGNVYFVDKWNENNTNIRACNVDKKKCAMVQQISLPSGAQVTALVIDPASRRMFYCTTHEGESTVWSSSLSGRSRIALATFGNCTGLAVDSFKRKLYVAETGPAQITRMDFFGDSHKTVVVGHPHLEAPQGLIIFEDWIYFLVANSIRLSRCRLYGSKACQPFLHRMFDANTFVIRHPSVQRNDLTNACAGHVCSNLCVLDDGGPQCLCPDGKIANDGNCEEPNYSLEAVFDGRRPGGHSRANEVTVSVLAAIFSLVVLYLAIYTYYRCVERRTRDNNYVEVRFQNTQSTNMGAVIEMPTNAISSGVACGARTSAAHEYVNPLQFVKSLVNRSLRKTTRPIGTAGLDITVPGIIDGSSDTESDLDDRDTKQIIK